MTLTKRFIVHRSSFICHCPEIAKCLLGISRGLPPALAND
jgi:hypothetical protein